MFNLKSEEILTCFLLIVVGYYIAKMFSKRCNGFRVGGQPIYIPDPDYPNPINLDCSNIRFKQNAAIIDKRIICGDRNCTYNTISRMCENPPPLPSPANSSQRRPQPTNEYCKRNMAQGLGELGYPRSNETYNNYCSNNGCYYSNDHSEHTCKSCDSINLQNIEKFYYNHVQ